ncbi:Bug family tripartite tricarboxylate transporter substrate binding protein [Variovorax sp. SRS16]|uniref:Bug family tripartite tricarboxylate transporter substrate binding protein n=1 Tax=Variovorax sp. SRS16 TaxID=282217 RepID=UPI0013A5B893|nr:tripartite tricarboxylate transporter substrate binding protein [Variovorax sp. SRS16]
MLAVAAGTALLAALASPALAQANGDDGWPNRPIRMVVPYPAGGSADAVARRFAIKLGESLGQTVVIDNRPGASGNIGTLDVMRARPDGYTLLLNPSAHVINPEISDKSPYRALEDFTPISQVAKGPLVLIVTPSLPVRTPIELAQLAKARPDSITFATSVIGSASHIAEELFNRVANVNILIVPYKGNAPAITDLMGGQVTAMFDPAVTSVPLVKSGKLKALAVTGRTRLASAPEIPTTEETGLKGLEFYTWYGLWAPKGLPEALAARLEKAARQVAGDAAFRQAMRDNGLEPVGSGRKAFADLIRQESALYRSIARQSNIRASAN